MGKTALAFDAWDRDRGVPEDQGTAQMFRRQAPPLGTRVFLGYFGGLGPPVWLPISSTRVKGQDKHGQTSTDELVAITMGFGHLLVHVWLPVNRPPSGGGLDSLTPGTVPPLLQCWPLVVSHLSWPPNAAATESGFHVIATLKEATFGDPQSAPTTPRSTHGL